MPRRKTDKISRRKDAEDYAKSLRDVTATAKDHFEVRRRRRRDCIWFERTVMDPDGEPRIIGETVRLPASEEQLDAAAARVRGDA